MVLLKWTLLILTVRAVRKKLHNMTFKTRIWNSSFSLVISLWTCHGIKKLALNLLKALVN